jgi:hypothetical protein
VAETDDHCTRRQRRVLAKLVGREPGTTTGTFELADGRVVEVAGPVQVDSDEAPRIGEKAFIVLDEEGRALRWEPYAAARLRRRSQ